MKKSLFSLKSYFVLFVLTLVSAAAFADVAPGDKQTILVGAAKSIQAGDQVTFVDKDNKVIYDGYQAVKNYSGDRPAGSELGTTFTVAKGNPSDSWAFVSGNDGAGKPIYLDDNADLKAQDLKPEVSWNWDNSTPFVQSASTPNHYIYYDKTLGYFKTTSEKSKVWLYTVKDVYCPTFAQPANDGTGDVTGSIRVETGKSKQVTVASATDGAQVYYQVVVGTGAYDDSKWINANNNTVGVEVGNNLYNDKTITIYAKTVYNDGETDVVKMTYNIVLLDNPTFSPADGSTTTVALDGTFNETVKTTVGATSALAFSDGTSTFFTESYSEQTKTEDIFDAYYDNKGAYPTTDGSFVVTSTQEKGGFKLEKSITVNFKKNPTSALGNLIATPASGSTIEKQGQEVTITYELNNTKDYELKNNGLTTLTLTPKDGTAAQTVSVTWDGNIAKFNVPAAFNEGEGVKAFDVAVPAGMFYAVSKTDDKTGFNKYENAAQTVSYGQTYKANTWTIEPWMKENPSDILYANFDVYPENISDKDLENLEVNFLNQEVRITDSENNDVTASGVTVSKIDKYTFQVAFPKDVVESYLTSASAKAAGFMVAFPENSLYTVGLEQNAKNAAKITGMIKFYEAVDITVPAGQKVEADESLTEYPNYEITVQGLGKNSNPANVYDVEIQKADGVTITGTDILGNTVNVAATLSKVDGKFYVTPSKALVQSNGNYTINIPADAFKASRTTTSAAGTVDLKIYAHVTFKTSTASYVINPTDKKPYFRVVAAAKVETGRTIEKAYATTLKASSTETTSDMKINGKNVYVHEVTTTGNLVKIYAQSAEEIEAGDYPVTIAADKFTANLDANKADDFNYTQTIKAVTWDYAEKAQEISTRDKSIDFTVTAKVDTETPVVSYIGYNVAKNMVFETATDNAISAADGSYAYPKQTITFSPLTANDNVIVKAENYLVEQYVGSYENKCYNPEMKIALTVNPYITYYVENTVYLVDTESEKVSYKIYGKKDGGEYVPAGTITYAETTAAGATATEETAAAFNNGYEPVFPVISQGTAATVTLEDGTEVPATEFTATYGAGKILANNYQMNFPNGTIYASANHNGDDGTDNKLVVNFRVKNHIDITSAEVWSKPSQTVTIALKGHDTVDDADASNLVYVADPTKATYADGSAVTFVENKAGNIQITAPATVGDYVITFPAGSVKANASTNKTDVTATVHVIDVKFAIDDVTKNRAVAADLAWCKAPTFPVKAYCVSANGETEITDKETMKPNEPVTIDYADATNMLKSSVNNITAADNENVVGEPGFTLSGNTLSFTNWATKDASYVEEATYGLLPNDKVQPYTISIQPKGLTLTYQGLVFENADYVKATINVVKEFVFNDAYASATTTTAKEVNEAIAVITTDGAGVDHAGNSLNLDVATVKYNRTFGTTKVQSVSLPFNSSVKDWNKAGIKVYRINFFHNPNIANANAAVLEITELGENDVMYANKPYIIQADATGDKNITFSTTLVKPEKKYVECATTKVEYRFYTNIEKVEKADLDAEESCILTGGMIQKAGGYLVPWRWAMMSENKKIDYVKFAVDGVVLDDDATAVSTVSADDAISGSIYDLSGRKLNSLKKGVNIVNGHKILVK